LHTHVQGALLALLADSATEETLDRDAGAVRQDPGELMPCDLGATESQVLQIGRADSHSRDPNEFPFTLGLIDIDNLDRGRRVLHCFHRRPPQPHDPFPKLSLCARSARKFDHKFSFDGLWLLLRGSPSGTTRDL